MNLRTITASALVAAAMLPASIAFADTLAVTCAGTPSNTGITWTASPAGGIAPYTYLWTSGATSASQTINVTPGTYSQTVTATDASSTAASATCSATVLPAAPTISAFTATPATITVGGSTVLAWTVANASTTSINNGIGNVSSTSLTVNPSVTTTYTLSATNPGGTTTSNVTVTVNPVNTGAPVISSFTATPSSVVAGSAVVLAWNVTNASTTSINNGVGTVSSTSITVNPLVTTTYTLTATNPNSSVTSNVTVTVTPVGGGTGLAAQIAALLAQINALKAQIAQLMMGGGTGTTTPPVITPGTCNPIGRDIARGAYGDDVKDLQKFLAKHPNLYPEGIVNGFYGPHTMQAVKRWQKENGLPMTGFFGRLSREIFGTNCSNVDSDHDGIPNRQDPDDDNDGVLDDSDSRPLDPSATSTASIIPTIGTSSNSTISLDDLLKLKQDNKNKNKGHGKNKDDDRDDD